METEAYHALHTGAAYQMRAETGVLQFEDADRVDFLQRMTTNDIAVLQPGRSAVTILTSPTAKILFAFTVLALGDKLLCLPAPGQKEALGKRLRGQIFFMDKVKITDVSSDFVRVRLMGPRASALIQESLGNKFNVNFTSAENDHFVEQQGCFVLQQFHFDVPGYEILLPPEIQRQVVQQWSSCGAVELTDARSYHTRRVECGQPAVGCELVDEYNPLEVGMSWACPDNKGCYTGQEIIARQITYDKITKSLVGIQSNFELHSGTDVVVEGRKAGKVTSAAHSPRLNRYIGLAVLKRPHNAPGTLVQVDDEEATVVQLPHV